MNTNNICYGTGITYIYDTGISRLARVLYYTIKGAKGNYKKSIHLPQVINACMENGCTLFDTSRAYIASERVLGRTLKKYPRDSYTIITKLQNSDQYNENVRGGFEKSLNELGVDYIDVYLMHWPVAGKYIDSWREMEKLYKEGKCKAIGVCNCNIHHLEEIKKNCEIMPMYNEFECHPLFTQNELRKYCNDNGIKILAYTSTGRMDERLRKTCLASISKKYNKSLTQIILKWHQQIGNIPIVSSSNVKHMLDNIDINGFELTKEEIDCITGININSRLRYDPDNCDFTQL